MNPDPRGRIHDYLNGVMQGIFADVRRDLVLSFAPPPAEKKTVPTVQESPEDVVKRIFDKE